MMVENPVWTLVSVPNKRFAMASNPIGQKIQPQKLLLELQLDSHLQRERLHRLQPSARCLRRSLHEGW